MCQKRAVQAGEGAAAEDNGTDGAGGFVVGDADVAAAWVLFDGHFRNDRHAHARADHAEDAAELAALENNLRVEPRAIASGNGGIAKTVAISQQKERFLAKVLEGESTAPREWVFLGKRGKEAFGQERKRVELVAADWQREDGDVNRGGAEALKQHGGDFFDDRELRLRELPREGSELRREKIRGDGGDHADANCPCDGVFALDDVALGGFQLAEDRAGAWQKRFARVGQADGAAEAVEQARAQFALQFEDLLGERRLRDMRLLGGTAEGAGFGDGAEVAKLVEFHKEQPAVGPPREARDACSPAPPAIGPAYLSYPNYILEV